MEISFLKTNFFQKQFFLLVLFVLIKPHCGIDPLRYKEPVRYSRLDPLRYSPYNTNFNNPYDYADAESYGANLFTQLYSHLNAVKREQNKCKNIPVPKTVLAKKYFNPPYEFQHYKYWYPPRDHQYVYLWAQNEAYRNSLFLSYWLQDGNALFPPGWLYLYLTVAAQLHSLQTIGYNSHKSIKGIKLPFESNEVFKVNWWTIGNYQKFDKPFALYAAQPRPNDLKYVRVVDFGTGDYSNDYTGHGFINNYLYDRQQFILNNSYEYSKFWKRPFQTGSFDDQQQQMEYIQQQQQQQYYSTDRPNQPYLQQFPQQPVKKLNSDRKDIFSGSVINTGERKDIFYPTEPPQQNYYNQDPKFQYNQLSNQQQPFDGTQILLDARKNISSLDEFSRYVIINKNSIPISNWDPLVDNDRKNLERHSNKDSPIGFDQWYIDTIIKNTALDTIKSANENPFVFKTLKYIDTYRYAKVWWNNETNFINNKEEIKPDERYYKFTGAKREEGTSWSSPYFWCVDPSNWLVTAMSPIWATNDFEYKNRLFFNKEPLRFVGLSEVVLNYEEVDINQCPGDRQLNAFSSTSLCDSTADCLPLPYYGLNTGGYECECLGQFHYPNDFQGPYKGKELGGDIFKYPLCIKSEDLIEYPNWVSKSQIEIAMPNLGASSIDPNFNQNFKRSVDPLEEMAQNPANSSTKMDHKKMKHKKRHHRKKRFIDKRNSFEKLRDSVYLDQDLMRRKCLSRHYQDIHLLNDDDERFILNLRNHANQVFKPQIAQAIRIAHVLSAYIQLHSPFSMSSVYTQSESSKQKSYGTNLKPDPQLEEYIIVGELMSTLMANYPIQEVNVFFNGTEYDRQKFFSSQNTLGFGLSMIRSDIEILLNRSNDDSHLSKSWYLDSVSRFAYGGDKKVYGGYYTNDFEKKFYQSAGPFDAGSLNNNFKFDRYGIEMSLRSSFEGMGVNNELAPKFYDAPSSGIWFGPFYDCQKRYMKTKTTLRMSYSVPIITSLSKLPIGFVSVVVGSDLRWWKINPCEYSKERNMFQGVHRCDAETTVCNYQEVPEFETGYYLASYKCICKPNYEFPFIDYGSSYFEGGTVEKEYDKKARGQPNIYDRLKCRPITVQRASRTSYWNTASSYKTNIFKYFPLVIICIFFYVDINILVAF